MATPRPPKPFNVPSQVNNNPAPPVRTEERWAPGLGNGTASMFGQTNPYPPSQVPQIPYRNLRTGRGD